MQACCRIPRCLVERADAESGRQARRVSRAGNNNPLIYNDLSGINNDYQPSTDPSS